MQCIFTLLFLLATGTSLHAQHKGLTATSAYHFSATFLVTQHTNSDQIMRSPGLQLNVGWQCSRRLAIFSGIGIVQRSYAEVAPLSVWPLYRSQTSYTRLPLLVEYSIPFAPKTGLFVLFGPHVDLIKTRALDRDPDLTNELFTTAIVRNPAGSDWQPSKWASFGWSTGFGGRWDLTPKVALQLSVQLETSAISPVSEWGWEAIRDRRVQGAYVLEARVGAQVGLRYFLALS